MRFIANFQSLAVATFVVLACSVGISARAHDGHLRTLASFCVEYSCSGGAGPGPLTMDSVGNLFGTATNGGVHGAGTAFELLRKPGTNKWIFRTIYNFCALNGCTDG